MTDAREQRIRRRAYELWELDGSPEGGAERYWDMAEGEWMPSFLTATTIPDGDRGTRTDGDGATMRMGGAPMPEAATVMPTRRDEATSAVKALKA